jgi:replicative DNA helicase
VSLERAAERSFIGAMLVDPDQLDCVVDWLEVDDFEGTAERQVFRAALALREGGAPVSPETVDGWIRSTVPHGTQLADAPYLISVMQETPNAGRAAVYARMVLEMSIRRHVAEGAVQLRQHAELANTTNEFNLVFAGVDGIRRGVEALHLRESRADDSHSVAPATDEHLLRLIRFPRQEEAAAEQAAVLSLIERPNNLAGITKWLKSADFGDEECGALFQEIVRLHEEHNPIDRLTVAWRAAKVGIEGPLTTALGSAHTQIDWPPDPIQAARRVLEQSVKAAVIATSEELEEAATDPSVNTTTVAYTRLNALWPQQRRLIKARFAPVSERGR